MLSLTNNMFGSRGRMAAAARKLGGLGHRRPAAIAFADVAGYSRMMAVDEAGTYERWISLYQQSLKPGATALAGRIEDLRGDGVVASFEDVSTALEWARRAHEAAAAVASGAASLALRIAIHFGEAYFSADGVFGDAVNLTARLQEHAAPGGTVVSEAALRSLGVRDDLNPIDLGALKFKHDDRPMRAYALGADHVAPELRTLSLLPTVAVLPLVNRSDDPADDDFAAGLLDDVVQSLAGLRELAVISRGSTIGFVGRSTDPVAAGRALGARYVLNGTLQRQGTAIRLSTKLTDVDSGQPIWSDRHSAEVTNIFDLQDLIVQRVVAGTAPQIRASELRATLRKRPDSMTAYDRYLRGILLLYSRDMDRLRQARQYLQDALETDPGFAMPAAFAAWWHCLWIGQGWSARPQDDAAKAFELASRAIALDPANAVALSVQGHLLSYLRRAYDAALMFFARALEACPNSAFAWMMSSTTLSYIGESREALRRAEHAMVLSPRDQAGYLFLNRLALAHFSAGDFAQAAHWARLCRAENPTYTSNLRLLAAALSLAGEIDEARLLGNEMMALEPDFKLDAFERERQPFNLASTAQGFITGLRQAGLQA